MPLPDGPNEQPSVQNGDLIRLAASIVKPRKTKNGLFADVGSALLSENGNVYSGVCCDSGSCVFCAEQAAIGAMITQGEYRIKKIVAVWKDEAGVCHVIAPCGNCRQLMKELDAENLENTDVVLDQELTVKLKELLPFSNWWKKQG